MPNSSISIFNALTDATQGESFDDLLTRPGCRIERIVSHGQSSPPGFWYEQDWDEWVLLLAGGAVLEFEDLAQARTWRVDMRAGDYLLIPKGQRHRVESTDTTAATIWLAVHITAD